MPLRIDDVFWILLYVLPGVCVFLSIPVARRHPSLVNWPVYVTGFLLAATGAIARTMGYVLLFASTIDPRADTLIMTVGGLLIALAGLDRARRADDAEQRRGLDGTPRSTGSADSRDQAPHASGNADVPTAACPACGGVYSTQLPECPECCAQRFAPRRDDQAETQRPDSLQDGAEPELWRRPNLAWAAFLGLSLLAATGVGLVLVLLHAGEWFRAGLTTVTAVFLLVLPTRFLSSQAVSWFGLRSPRRATLLPVLVLSICATLAYIQFSAMFETRWPLSESERDVYGALLFIDRDTGWLGALLCVVFVPAFCEEAFFRGFALRSLLRRMPFGSALVLTSVVFSLVHFDMRGAIPRFVLGAVLGVLARQTGSVWYPMLLHALVNASALVGFHTGNRTALPEEYTSAPAAVAALFGFFLALRWLAWVVEEKGAVARRVVGVLGIASTVGAVWLSGAVAHDRNLFGPGQTKGAQANELRRVVRTAAYTGDASGLVAGLRSDEPELRNIAGDALLERLRKTPRDIEVLKTAREDADPLVRAYAGCVLARMESDAPALAGFLQHEIKALRLPAAEALCRLDHKAVGAAPALANALRDEDVRVRVNAAEALLALGEETDAAATALVEALLDRRTEPRPLMVLRDNPKAAARGMPALARMLRNDLPTRNDQERARRLAAEILGLVGKDAVPVLIEGLRDSRADVRLHSAWALRSVGVGAAEAIPSLEGAAQDPDPGVRSAARDALAVIKGERVELLDERHRRHGGRAANIRLD